MRHGAQRVCKTVDRSVQDVPGKAAMVSKRKIVEEEGNKRAHATVSRTDHLDKLVLGWPIDV